MSLHQAVEQLFGLIQLLMLLRILLSWFPNINWWNQPFKLLNDITEPIFEPFRRLIPPISGFDLSPIFAFLFLGIVQSLVLSFI